MKGEGGPGYDCSMEEVSIPSLLLRLGRSLAALVSAKRTVGIKTKNSDVRCERLFGTSHGGVGHLWQSCSSNLRSKA